jgi:DNA-binding GntR family transcriptional regulator
VNTVIPALPKRVTMKDQVYDTLRTLILNGKLVPGQPLVEAALSAQLGTSKTPLREAFLRLEADGLVVLSPHKGATVSPLSLKELRDSQFVRLALEVAAVPLIAKLITPAELEQARYCLARMRAETEAGDWDTYRLFHRQFHVVLFQATRNDALAKLLLDLFDGLQRYSQFCLERNAGYWHRDEREHHDAFAAVERGDVEAYRATFASMNDRFSTYVEQALRRHERDLNRYFKDGAGGDGPAGDGAYAPE